MKQKLSAILLAALLLTISSCSEKAETDDGARMTIAATTYPVYLFTTAVTENTGVNVELIINQEVSCLHDYTLTIHDMKVIERADVIIMNGADLENFMTDALAASRAPVIDCSDGIDLLPATGHHDHNHEADVDEGSHYDPHIWLTEEGAVAMMSNILHGLGTLDETHLEQYTENFQKAIALLPDDPLAGATLDCPYFITFHDGFQYFAHDNGLTLLKSIEEEEGSEASAAEFKEIIALINEYDIPVIFTETNGSDATARAIARETGVEIRPLNMIMSGDGTGIQPYIDAMNANYDAILRTLGGN